MMLYMVVTFDSVDVILDIEAFYAQNRNEISKKTRQKKTLHVALEEYSVNGVFLGCKENEYSNKGVPNNINAKQGHKFQYTGCTADRAEPCLVDALSLVRASRKLTGSGIYLFGKFTFIDPEKSRFIMKEKKSPEQ